MCPDGDSHRATAIQKGRFAVHVFPPAQIRTTCTERRPGATSKDRRRARIHDQEPEAAFLAKLSMKVFVRSTFELVSSGSSNLSESYMLFIASGVAMPVRE